MANSIIAGLIFILSIAAFVFAPMDARIMAGVFLAWVIVSVVFDLINAVRNRKNEAGNG